MRWQKNAISEKLIHCVFILMGEYSKLDRVQTMGTRGKISAIWWNIKINLQKLVDVCGCELPIILQNFTQKDLTEVKIFQKVLGGLLFLNTLYMLRMNVLRANAYSIIWNCRDNVLNYVCGRCMFHYNVSIVHCGARATLRQFRLLWMKLSCTVSETFNAEPL